MNNSPLITKSKEFALQIIKVCNQIKREKKETVLTNQLIRSGTSVGANIREAFYGHGTADFIAKLQIALKECAESEYWLELLLESGYCSDPVCRSEEAADQYGEKEPGLIQASKVSSKNRQALQSVCRFLLMKPIFGSE